MGTTDNESTADIDDAAAVGTLLAEAFLARISRFAPSARSRLLVACHHRLLQGDLEIAHVLFSGKPLMPMVEVSLPVTLVPILLPAIKII